MPWNYGAVAQLGERSNRTAEVVGSIPSGSTNFPKTISKILRRPLGRRGPVAQKSARSQQDRQSQRLLYARATAALVRSVIEIVLQRAAVCSVRSALRLPCPAPFRPDTATAPLCRLALGYLRHRNRAVGGVRPGHNGEWRPGDVG